MAWELFSKNTSFFFFPSNISSFPNLFPSFLQQKINTRLEWYFLRGIILKMMGFNHNWIDLVMPCVTTTSFSIMIGG
jgi:hypothetical protein